MGVVLPGLAAVVLVGCLTDARKAKTWHGGDCPETGVCGVGKCILGKCASPCTNSDACGEGALCFSTVCQPVEQACKTGLCDDANACTDDACKPGTSTCVHGARQGACDDLDKCTQGDECFVQKGAEGGAGVPRWGEV
ncbi:MAG: hypothetical protein EXR79_17825 [Myxococcales bacterium]|nr:hypothetical protein [Myxococcales bacterium]